MNPTHIHTLSPVYSKMSSSNTMCRHPHSEKKRKERKKEHTKERVWGTLIRFFAKPIRPSPTQIHETARSMEKHEIHVRRGSSRPRPCRYRWRHPAGRHAAAERSRGRTSPGRSRGWGRRRRSLPRRSAAAHRPRGPPPAGRELLSCLGLLRAHQHHGHEPRRQPGAQVRGLRRPHNRRLARSPHARRGRCRAGRRACREIPHGIVLLDPLMLMCPICSAADQEIQDSASSAAAVSISIVTVKYCSLAFNQHWTKISAVTVTRSRTGQHGLICRIWALGIWAGVWSCNMHDTYGVIISTSV